MQVKSKQNSLQPDYQVLFESAPSALLVLSPELIVTAVNDAYLSATMTKRNEVLGRGLFEVFPENPNDPDADGESNLRASLNRVLVTGKSDTMSIQKYDIRQPDGGSFEVRYWSPLNSPILNDQGQVVGIIHHISDVTEFKIQRLEGKDSGRSAGSQTRTQKMEADIFGRSQDLQQLNDDLRKSEEKFRLLVDSVKDYAIIMLDLDGRILSWSPGAEQVMGYRADEILGKHVSRFYLPEDLKQKKDEKERETAKREGRFEEEAFRIRKNGSQFWASVIVTPIYDHQGNLISFVKVTRDLSERKKRDDEITKISSELAAQTVALQAVNRELEAFCYSVSHDLRAPLRSMTGFSQALIEQYSKNLDSQGVDYLQRIGKSAKVMGDLIEGLLNLSRLSRRAITKETVHLSSLVENIFSDLRDSRQKSKIALTLAKDVVVEGDAQLLQAALTNLLENAMKFSEKKESPQIEFGFLEKNGEKVYFIRDNGAGFDMRYYDKLFGAFQRLHSIKEFEGTGIGLATVQRIIHRHGGKIWAEGKPGEGATFYFTI